MTHTSIQPYLYFGGRCEEAIDFYRSAIGAKVELLMRFSESPDPPPPGMLQAGFENKVMHATLQIDGALLMASDGCDDTSSFKGFSLSLSVPTEAKAHDAFAALSEGGQVQMPLGQTFWSPLFGMVTDRYGVAWMVSVAATQTPG